VKQLKLLDSTRTLTSSTSQTTAITLGNHGLGNKITMHEESVRVPMFIHSPLPPVKRAKSDAPAPSSMSIPTLHRTTPAPQHRTHRSWANRCARSWTQPTLPPCAVTSSRECVGPAGDPAETAVTGHRMVRTDHLEIHPQQLR